MAANLTTASGILKTFYLPAVREQLNNKVMLLAQLERSSDSVEGAEAVLSLHVTRNSGVTSIGDGGTLPTPGNQGYVQSRVPLRTQAGTIQVTVQAVKALASDRSSFLRIVSSEMKGLVKDARRNVNRQLFGTSDGQIAQCGTTTASTTVQLAATTDARQMRQFEVGMVVDISTTASDGDQAVATARPITAVDAANLTITIGGGAVTTSSSHQVERSLAGGSGGTNGAGASTSSNSVPQKEMTGLQSIVASSGKLFNVDPATYPSWAVASAAADSTTTNPSENLFEKMLDEVEIASGEDANLIVSSHTILRGYSNNLTTMKRQTDLSKPLKGGFTGLGISVGSKSATFTADRDCPIKYAFLLNTDHLKVAEVDDWDWMDDDGAILSRVGGQAAYTAALTYIADLYTDQRNAHGVASALVGS